MSRARFTADPSVRDLIIPLVFDLSFVLWYLYLNFDVGIRFVTHQNIASNTKLAYMPFSALIPIVYDINLNFERHFQETS